MATVDIDVTGLDALKESADFIEKMRIGAAELKGHLRESSIFAKQMGGGYRPPFGYGAPPAANSNIPGVGSSSTYNNLNMLFMRESLKHFKTFPQFTRNLGNVSNALEGMMANLAKLASGSALGLAGGAAGVAATMAAFTLNRSESFANKAAQAFGVGVTPYAPESFGANLKMYLGGDQGAAALFGGLTAQRTTLGGQAI